MDKIRPCFSSTTCTGGEGNSEKQWSIIAIMEQNLRKMGSCQFSIVLPCSPLSQSFCRRRPLRNWRFWHGKGPRAFRAPQPSRFSTQVLEELRRLPCSHRFWHVDVCILAINWCILLLLAMNAYPSLHHGPLVLWHDSLAPAAAKANSKTLQSWCCHVKIHAKGRCCTCSRLALLAPRPLPFWGPT